MAEPKLEKRVVVVTGVSRRAGIGFALAQRFLDEGASVLIHSFSAHDAERSWGADPGGIDAVIADLGGTSDRLEHVEADLGDPDMPHEVIEVAVKAFGGVDALVVNHARSSDQTLQTTTVEELDRTWAVDARAAVLLTQAFAASHDDARPNGRVVVFTSGQHLGPMSDELPYAISKGAIHQMTLARRCTCRPRDHRQRDQPGPGRHRLALRRAARAPASRLPRRRWGRPEDIAAVVAWLVSEESAPVTGQVIDAEGGFRR